MGLNAVLKEKVEFANGAVKSANFSDSHTLRMGVRFPFWRVMPKSVAWV